MTRAELEQVRAALHDAVGLMTLAPQDDPDVWVRIISALAILDAEVAKPVERQWGIQYNDGQGTCIDTTIYPFPESEAKAIAMGDSRRKLYIRTAAHQVPAGPWERAE